MTSNVLLGGYPAKQCARRTHNDFDPTVPEPAPVSEAVAQRMAAGRVFEDEVVVPALVAALGDRCVSIAYGDHRADKARRISETVAAMEAGVPVIVGGQLPDDTAGSRTGSPDVLVRVTGDGEWARYVPADIKHHGTAKKAGKTSVLVSRMAAGFDRVEVSGWSASTSYRVDDAMQLAHYTRMLEAMGRHPGADLMVGAILGTTDFTELTGERYGFVWYDLAAMSEKVSSTTTESGWEMASVMDVYDREFGFRVQVAQTARDGGTPLVVPVGKAECGECPYADWCREQAGARDASFAIGKGQLTEREWAFLHEQGLGSIDALADAVPEGDLLAGFSYAAAPLPTPAKRLGDVMERARMCRDQIAFERTGTGMLTVPSADVEIDFDVEWHPVDGHVYQWGARVRYGSDEATATYAHTAVSFDPLDEESAHKLAMQFFEWMEGFVAEHEAAGRSVAIYHWTNPETRHTARVLGGVRADRLFAGRFVDLKTFMASRYKARDGFSLKTVAPVFGFSWRCDDAGGALSTVKIDEARSATDPQVRAEARDWLMRYNEDDCAAQAAIRDGLRAHVAEARIHG